MSQPTDAYTVQTLKVMIGRYLSMARTAKLPEDRALYRDMAQRASTLMGDLSLQLKRDGLLKRPWYTVIEHIADASDLGLKAGQEPTPSTPLPNGYIMSLPSQWVRITNPDDSEILAWEYTIRQHEMEVVKIRIIND